MKWMMMALSALVLSGCMMVPESQRAADRATYRAIAPEYQRYVESDPALDQRAKALRLQTLKSWEMRLDAIERSSDE